uniref:Uncharacterized protein n=1 Tax=Rhizophora mucronata TaxID=61149 RepID=A0A2P2P4V8_RHIMU
MLPLWLLVVLKFSTLY